ncbi:hypothetical protein HY490_03080 [Candidatus Woesearchaeota archaeon]|nr:hypothetical protein [Candidatus Woesearchaeota archaeon]
MADGIIAEIPCYICTTPAIERNAVLTIVSYGDAGRQIVELYDRLGLYAHLAPEGRSMWTHVKVGACNTHRPNLNRLEALLRQNGNELNTDIIRESLGEIEAGAERR